MSFSIIIPSRNMTNLLACVFALRAAGETAPVIIVWDGESIPDVREYYEMWGVARGQFILGVQPFCFARNVNLGIFAAGDDDVVILNDDALLQPGVGLVEVNGPERGGPLAVMHYAMSKSPFSIVSAAMQEHEGSPVVPQLIPRCHPEPLSIRAGFKMLPFTAVAIKRECLNVVGGLEERFAGVYGGEDDDYCYRARRQGFLLGVFDGCMFDHHTLQSTFRPDGLGRSIDDARTRFAEIHGFAMGSR